MEPWTGAMLGEFNEGLFLAEFAEPDFGVE